MSEYVQNSRIRSYHPINEYNGDYKAVRMPSESRSGLTCFLVNFMNQ